MGKRGYGEGTIYQYREKWRAQLTVNEKRISYTGNTRRECQEWIRKTLDQISQGLTYESSKLTFGEFFEDWIAVKETRVRQHTFIQYQNQAQNHILPALAHIKLKDLTPARLQQYYNQLIDNGTGSPTIRMCHAIIRSCLGHAFRLGLIPQNPCSLCSVPRSQSREIKIWNESQVSQFLTTIQGHPNEHLYRLALATGMRMGELLGLQWKDIDWSGSLNVSRQVVRYQGVKFNFTPPKTKKGKRTINLGPQTLESLRDQLARVNYFRNFYLSKWQEHDLVFPTRSGVPQHRGNISREIHKLAQRAGLPVLHFHDLRHTAASLMLNHGIPVIVVSQILGHAKTSITMDCYGHLIPGMQDQATSLMDSLVHPIEVHFK